MSVSLDKTCPVCLAQYTEMSTFQVNCSSPFCIRYVNVAIAAADNDILAISILYNLNKRLARVRAESA